MEQIKRGPGRPKKIVDPNAPIKEKRPRGRPKKVIDPNYIPPPKNPVGRPRKIVDLTVVKRHVGRPHKDFTNLFAIGAQALSSGVIKEIKVLPTVDRVPEGSVVSEDIGRMSNSEEETGEVVSELDKEERDKDTEDT